MTNSSTVIKVKHPDHGMYSTSNNVTITGVKSGISTTLNGAITATATSLTLTSATGFDVNDYLKIYYYNLKKNLSLDIFYCVLFQVIIRCNYH